MMFIPPLELFDGTSNLMARPVIRNAIHHRVEVLNYGFEDKEAIR